MAKPWADQPFGLIATPTEQETKGVCNIPLDTGYTVTEQNTD